MNTVTPIALPPPAPDPSTPGTRPSPTAFRGAAATALAGTPVAVVVVWALETYGTAHGQPLHFDSVTATAIGSVGAAVTGYLWQVFQGALDAFVNWTVRA